MPNHKVSVVWKLFDKITENGVTTTKCTLCSHTAKFHKNTTNLKDHLRRKHPKELHEAETEGTGKKEEEHSYSSFQDSCDDMASDDKSDPLASTSVEVPITAPPKKQRKLDFWVQSNDDDNIDKIASDHAAIDRALLFMIVKGYHPVSLVEERGFNEFVKHLRPHYTLPSVDKISDELLPNEYRSVQENVIKQIEAIQHMSISVELWSAEDNVSLITITGHFISDFVRKSYILGTEGILENQRAQDIAEVTRDVLSQYLGASSNKVAMVSDNARNVLKAASVYLDTIHHPCVGLTLNLCVQEALTNAAYLNKILNKCRAMHAHFKHYDEAAEKLSEIQEEMELPILKLKKDDPTRWISTFIMLERFSEVHVSLSAALQSLPEAPEDLKFREWEIIDDVIPILKLFHKVAEEFSKETYPALSIVIPLITGLQHVLLQKSPATDAGISLRAALLEVVRGRLGFLEYTDMVAMSTILDPRFKKTGFGLPENAENAHKLLIKELTQQMAGDSAEQSNGANTSEAKVEGVSFDGEQDDIWKLFDTKAFSQTSSKTSNSSADKLVYKYLEMPLMHRNDDPLMFWKTYSSTFPVLCELAMKYLSIPATCIPSDRLFSKQGFRLTERRNRMDLDNLHEIVFLNHNMTNDD